MPLRRLFAYNNLSECACNRNCRFAGRYGYCAVGVGCECCRRYCYCALSRFKHTCVFIIGVPRIGKRRAVIAYRNTFQNGIEHITQHNIICLCDRCVALVGDCKRIGYLTVFADYEQVERLFDIRNRTDNRIDCFGCSDGFCDSATRYRNVIGNRRFGIKRRIRSGFRLIDDLSLRICRNIYACNNSGGPAVTVGAVWRTPFIKKRISPV